MVVTMLLGLMPTEVFAIGTGETGPVAWSMDTYSASTISDGGKITITVGKTESLRGEDGYYHSWSSSDGDVATVSGTGGTVYVTGESVGRANITHKYYTYDYTHNSLTRNQETFTVEVKESEATQNNEAIFYYLKTPTSDPASNNTDAWGEAIGNGTVNVAGASWDSDKNAYVASEPGRVVSWPSGFENGVVPRSSSHWGTIFNAFKSTLNDNTITAEDIESITLVPYKISKNNGTTPDKHVDCTVVIVAKKVASVTWYLWDAGENDYKWKAAENVRVGNNVYPPAKFTNDNSEDYLPRTKEVNGRTYRLVSWYDNSNLSGTAVNFPYSVNANVNFYAKYLPEYIVSYELSGGVSSEELSYGGLFDGDSTPTIADPTRTGYEFLGWNPAVAEKVTADAIYVAQWRPINLSYTVNYYKDSVAEGNLLGSDEGTGTFEAAIPWTDGNYLPAGYVTPGATSGQTTITAVEANNVLNVVYSKNTALGYTVNYLEEVTTTNEDGEEVVTEVSIAEAKTVDGQTYKAEVTENAIDIVGYDKVNTEEHPSSVTITIDVENNIINFYYTKRTDLSYTVNYLEQGTNRVLAKAKTVDSQTYQASVTEEAIDIAGYNKVAPTSETITIGVGENVINFYYTKRTDLGYTVNYYKDSETAANLIGTDTGSGTFDAEIPYEDGKYLPTGYLKPGTISGQMIITAIEENNVMNVVYTKRAFTVEPLESIMYSGVDTRGLRQPVVKDAADPNKVLRLNIDYELAYETDWADYTNVRLDADGKLTSVPVIVRGKGDIYGKNAVSTYARTADSDDNSEVRVWYAITPREVTLTSASAAKVYDGTPLVSHNVTVGGNGFVGAQGVTYTFYGSQTEIGESYNTYDFELIEGTLERNYNITKRDGILTVTDRQTFNLTVNYIDEGGAPIAPAYVGAFAAGAPYFVQSPYIEGYTPNFDTVESGAAGMPRADVTLTVVYTINPENDPNRGEIVEDGEGYTLVEITDENVPLAGGLHKDCILHFLLMCAAFIVQLFYTKKRKKYQQRIFELRKKLGDTDMDDEDEKK